MAGGEVIPGTAHNAALRRARVVELCDSGQKFQDIAKTVGVSVATAWGDYQRALREHPEAAVEKYRANIEQRRTEQLARIDMERDAVTEMVLRPHLLFDIKGQVIMFKGVPYTDCKPVVEAIKLMIQLDDQEAKLLGLHAAQKVHADVSVNFTVTVPENMQKALT